MHAAPIALDARASETRIRTTIIIDTLDFTPLADFPETEVEALLDAAFGTDRRGRTAYRLREGVSAIPGLSFAAVDDYGQLVGSFQSWPVELAGDDGRVVPLVLVGPIAIQPDRQQGGLGRALTRHALAAIDAAGVEATVLIGDPEYYGRFFGYSDAVTGQWRVPGPVEQRRLLARLTGGPALPVSGLLRPRSR
ncbi:GNAT family N-acetyltransferase [Sphingomonas quercus]|uniref:GNAT family N-acetyltransferase n=1 Tax=Sphingomonas quercus TaxID=2842451 RepID=UPI00263B43B3|nr:N-acetyltransferase [Sphingomonas quercus]